MDRFHTFSEFWPFYLAQHLHRSTRVMHMVGVLLLLPLLALALFYHPLYLLLMPICGYGFSWVSHYFVEKNKPATFDYPVWSFMADFKMCFLMLTGRMASELKRL